MDWDTLSVVQGGGPPRLRSTPTSAYNVEGMWLSGPCARSAAQMRDLLSSEPQPVHNDQVCTEVRALLGEIAWRLARRDVTPNEVDRVCREGLGAFEQLLVVWHAQRLNDFEKFVSNHEDYERVDGTASRQADSTLEA